MPDTVALHIFCNQESKQCSRKIARKPDWDQMVDIQNLHLFNLSPYNKNHVNLFIGTLTLIHCESICWSII